MIDVLIAGGGLAGLINALLLAKAGLNVVLVEKKAYPFHKVCGEYISNEVVPFLQSIDAYPTDIQPANINKFILSSPSGKLLKASLDLGGFGISRYQFDNFLFKKAQQANVKFITNVSVENINYSENCFHVELSNGDIITSKITIGAFGKRSKLDKRLNRSFIQNRSPYVGIKYHAKAPFPMDTVALHNFKGGYCGISAIENELLCACYLTLKENLKTYSNIPDMEKAVLYKNPHLRSFFEVADFQYDKPEVINEISFEPKKAVEEHVLMSGDAAGLITPLCGNGMAMAIHSAKILSDLIISFFLKEISRQELEQNYQQKWTTLFARRLWAGRKIQLLFGSTFISEMSILFFSKSDFLLGKIMSKTHGKVF